MHSAKTEPKTETTVNLVKPKPNRKPQFFAKPNRKPNRSHFLLTVHPYNPDYSMSLVDWYCRYIRTWWIEYTAKSWKSAHYTFILRIYHVIWNL